MADAAEQLLQIHADAGVGVFCIAHICFNYRQTLLTHCHKLMPMLGSVFSALLTFVSIKICAEWLWWRVHLVRVQASRWRAGERERSAGLSLIFETPGAFKFVVSFAFVCAEGNNWNTAEPGVVLSIMNCARSLLHVLQVQSLTRKLAHRTVQLTKKQMAFESLEHQHILLRESHPDAEMPPAKKARSE